MCRAGWTKEQTCCPGAMSPQRSGFSIRKRFRESWRSLGRQRSNSSPQTTTLIAQLIFRTTRCVDPRLAQPPPLRFSPIALILQVIRWIRKQNTQVLLVVPLWRNQHWFLELSQLLMGHPLSEWQNDMAPPAQAVGSALLASRWEPADLPRAF